MTFQPPLFLSREATRLGSDRQLRRRYSDGFLTRLATGVYIDTQLWAALDATDQYRSRVRAHALRGDPQAQFSHDSAAAEWRLPSIGPWPQSAHQVAGLGNGGTSRVGIRRHAIGIDPDAIALNGIVVTSLARTVVDMASSTPLCGP